MKRRLQPVLAFIMLPIAILACASPLQGGGEQPPPSDQVATVVASTLQALTPISDGGTTP